MTNCVIFMRHSDKKLPVPGNSYLQEAVVNKYYIGLGHPIKRYEIGETSNPRQPLFFYYISYPLVQIDKNGLVALKCPTISGGQWMDRVEFPLCNDENLVMKHRKLNIITRFAQIPQFLSEQKIPSICFAQFDQFQV